MFLAEKNVPKVYYDNYDFRIYSKIIEVLYNSTDYNIKAFMNSRQPLSVRDTFLEYLKNYYCQDFPDWLSSNQLRLVLQNYWNLVEYRGTEKGIKSAINVALKTIDTNIKYNIIFPRDTDLVSVVHLILLTNQTIYNNKFIQFMFNIVRPVGFTLKIISISSMRGSEVNISISAPDYRSIKYKDSTYNEATSDIKSLYIEDESIKPHSQTLGQYLEIAQK